RLDHVVAPQAPLPLDCELTWYDKGHVSPGRKMGHISGRASSPEEVATLRETLMAYEDHYWTHTKREAS
ncbi:MAG: phosphoribosylaminoimidazole carboxylase (NCAIR synthetase), partial [Bradymonadia bacterium]